MNKLKKNLYEFWWGASWTTLIALPMNYITVLLRMYKCPGAEIKVETATMIVFPILWINSVFFLIHFTKKKMK